MEFLTSLRDDWFTLLQSLGIVGGLFFTGWAFRIDAKARRVGNGFELTKQHREIWTQLYSRPGLKRVIDPAADVRAKPITDEEEMFVNFLILHLAGAHRAMKNGMYILPEELSADAASFFSLPIPKAVWEQTKPLRNREFARFVEARISTTNAQEEIE